jgi:hypothetical protein
MTRSTITDLLAGVIDLVPNGTPPHRPGPCTALCVPACVESSPSTGAAAPPAPRENRGHSAEHDGRDRAEDLQPQP